MGKRMWKIEEKKEGTCVSPNTFPLHFFHLVDQAFVQLHNHQDFIDYITFSVL